MSQGAGLFTRFALGMWAGAAPSARAGATSWIVANGQSSGAPFCALGELLVGAEAPSQELSSLYLLPPRRNTPWVLGYSVAL